MWHNIKWKKPKSVQYKRLWYLSLSLTGNKWYIPIVILDNHLLKWTNRKEWSNITGALDYGGKSTFEGQVFRKAETLWHCLVKCNYIQPSLHDSVGIYMPALEPQIRIQIWVIYGFLKKHFYLSIHNPLINQPFFPHFLHALWIIYFMN